MMYDANNFPPRDSGSRPGFGLMRSEAAATATRTVALFVAAAAMALAMMLTCTHAAYGAEGDEGSGSSDNSSQASSGSASSASVIEKQEANLVDPTQRADNSFIYDTTIEDILSEPDSKEGQIVQFVGEAIGDAITSSSQGDMTWVQVSSTTPGSEASISVLMTTEQAKQIDHFGRYGVTGTMVQVRGTFHQACSEHDGLLDLHATNVAVIAHGEEHPDELNPVGFVPGIIAVLIGGALMAVFYVVRERLR